MRRMEMDLICIHHLLRVEVVKIVSWIITAGNVPETKAYHPHDASWKSLCVKFSFCSSSVVYWAFTIFPQQHGRLWWLLEKRIFT